jgi:hypothetical protein
MPEKTRNEKEIAQFVLAVAQRGSTGHESRFVTVRTVMSLLLYCFHTHLIGFKRSEGVFELDQFCPERIFFFFFFLISKGRLASNFLHKNLYEEQGERKKKKLFVCMRIGSCFIRKRKKNFSNFRAKKKKSQKKEIIILVK